jgi:hypothetical protein
MEDPLAPVLGPGVDVASALASIERRMNKKKAAPAPKKRRTP